MARRKKVDVGSMRVSIRPAVRSDKQRILEFCRKEWGGTDYIPEVWDDWIKDRKARLVVATVDKKPVAMAHAYFQTRHDAWLEGVRVNPDYRGRGIAGKLNKALADWAAQNGAVYARLCTGSDNTASQRHLLKTGFKLLQTYDRFSTRKPLTKKPVGVVDTRAYEPDLWRHMKAHAKEGLYKGLFGDGWTFYPLTAPILRRLSRGRRLLLSRDNTSLAAATLFEKDERGYTLGFTTAGQKHIVEHARYLRYLLSRKRGSNRRKQPRIRAILPRGSASRVGLKRAGFRRKGAILVYEKKLRKH